MIRRVAAGLAVLVLLTGCASTTQDREPASDAPPAREGRTAASERITFTPEQVSLPSGQSAPVEPARTVEGELVVPEDVRHVGWWDGSSAVNDPFGSTVIAGHVDSASAGLGYFVRLLQVEQGDQLTVGGGGHEQVYRVTSVESWSKQTLATSSGAFDQTGDHRLVLITCTGSFTPGEGYDRNLVVFAEPVGQPYDSRT